MLKHDPRIYTALFKQAGDSIYSFNMLPHLWQPTNLGGVYKKRKHKTSIQHFYEQYKLIIEI